MTARLFHVVAFDGEESVAVVPDIWRNGGGCYWPPYKSLQRMQTAVVKEEVPGQDWNCHNCRVLYSARDTRMFTLLEAMQTTIKANNRLLRLLMARGPDGVEASTSNQLPEGIVFPLKTVGDLEEFDRRLSDETTASSIVKYLADLGGRDVYDTVSRAMRTMIDTGLARLYNLKGLKGKRRMQDLTIISILFRCLRMNPVTRQANLKDMEAAITKWLGGARDRDGGGVESLERCRGHLLLEHLLDRLMAGLIKAPD